MTPDEAFGSSRRRRSPCPRSGCTIPGGYRLTQIADRVEEELGIHAKRFLKATEDGDWSLPPYLPKDAPSIEGSSSRDLLRPQGRRRRLR